MISNLETLIPGLAEQRKKERENRDFVFAGLTHTLCGVEVRALTPRLRLALQMMRNAFVCGVSPLEGDVFVFLQLLSPGAAWPQPWRLLSSAWLQWRLRRHVAKLDLDAAVREIQTYLIGQLQDRSESSTESGMDHGPWVHWIAADASWWMQKHGGFTMRDYLDTPYLVLQQLYRGFQVNNPVVEYDSSGKATVLEPNFINESDRLVGQWQRQFRAAAAEIMRAPRPRLD